MKKPTKLNTRIDEYYLPKLEIVFSRLFENDSTHYDVLYVIIKQLAKSGFASEKEIMEEWCNLLQVELQKGQL